jgi:biotin transport system substrate-specific component
MDRSLVLIALFAAFVAALGLVPPIALPLPLGLGVPITAQSLGVMLCGTVLGARRGALAVLLFLLLVAAGLPLLSGGRGGLGVFTGPTAGFLVGFPIAAFIAGLVVQHIREVDVRWTAMVGAFAGGIVALYVCGIGGLMVQKGMTAAAAAVAVMPFIPGDMFKVVLTGLITAALARARPDSVLSLASSPVAADDGAAP